MIANVKLVGEYSNSYEFMKEFSGDFLKMCELLKISEKEVADNMKENEEEDKFMALFDLQIGKYSICDEDVLTMVLEKEQGNYFIRYDKDNDYFEVFKIEKFERRTQ